MIKYNSSHPHNLPFLRYCDAFPLSVFIETWKTGNLLDINSLHWNQLSPYTMAGVKPYRVRSQTQGQFSCPNIIDLYLIFAKICWSQTQYIHLKFHHMAHQRNHLCCLWLLFLIALSLIMIIMTQRMNIASDWQYNTMHRIECLYLAYVYIELHNKSYVWAVGSCQWGDAWHNVLSREFKVCFQSLSFSVLQYFFFNTRQVLRFHNCLTWSVVRDGSDSSSQKLYEYASWSSGGFSGLSVFFEAYRCATIWALTVEPVSLER